MGETPDPAEPSGDGAASRTDDDRFGERYADRGRLGVGAMGDVRLCDDRLIGREIALKIALSEGSVVDAGVRDRFVREARVQARLEHPSVVPVYDMGAAGSGAPWFTMKRVHGVTLRRVLRGIASGNRELADQFSRRRLLAAFASICLTVDYAHGRGVLHGDLKPENVMLGTYGELYVLDWGVARDLSAQPATEVAADGGPREHGGTAGYAPPETLRGEAGDARGDVYALGAILFEILALERLHPADPGAAIASTLRGTDARPSARRPDLDVPPELDEICARATALAPADRTPSVRALYDAVDRFLEGDRDLARRRELSASHARAALELVERALGPGDAGARGRERVLAMGEVSRALAFDPRNPDARRLLMRLLTEPPRELPHEVEAELARHHHAQRQQSARGGAILYTAGLVVTVAAIHSMGARLTWLSIAVVLLFGGAAAMLFRLSRAQSDSAASQTARIALATQALSSISAVGGPLILVPSLVMTNAIGFLMQARARRGVVIGTSCAAILVPLSLEWFGLIPPSYVIRDGVTIVQSRLFPFTETTHAFLTVFTLGFLVAISLYFIRFRDMLTDAEQRLFLHAWQLRQLVSPEPPEAGRPAHGEPGDR